MARKDKLKIRLLSRPKDFTWDELTTLLKSEGFVQINNSGSRRKFYNKDHDVLINLHAPHPGNIIKTYVIKDVIAKLKECNNEQQ